MILNNNNTNKKSPSFLLGNTRNLDWYWNTATPVLKFESSIGSQICQHSRGCQIMFNNLKAENKQNK